MFQRTFSFCRRLLRRAPATSSASVGGTGRATAIAEDERRLWVRYRADVEAQVRLPQAATAQRIAARVRDVSAGGVNLLTERPFQLGQILSLELPGAASEVQIVLACVVRSEMVDPGQWSVGCAFSRELGAADLEKFGVTRAPAASDDQRVRVRHECALKATYQRIGEEEAAAFPAKVLNISASGVGLVLQETLDAGSLINLQLRSPAGAVLRTILACVVHSTERADGDRVAGCNFIRELAEEDLVALL